MFIFVFCHPFNEVSLSKRRQFCSSYVSLHTPEHNTSLRRKTMILLQCKTISVNTSVCCERPLNWENRRPGFHLRFCPLLRFSKFLGYIGAYSENCPLSTPMLAGEAVLHREPGKHRPCFPVYIHVAFTHTCCHTQDKTAAPGFRFHFSFVLTASLSTKIKN